MLFIGKNSKFLEGGHVKYPTSVPSPAAQRPLPSPVGLLGSYCRGFRAQSPRRRRRFPVPAHHPPPGWTRAKEPECRLCSLQRRQGHCRFSCHRHRFHLQQLTAVRLTESWCSGQWSGLSLWGGRPELRTQAHQRPPGPMQYQMAKALPEISISTLRPSSTQQPASCSAGHPMPNN